MNDKNNGFERLEGAEIARGRVISEGGAIASPQADATWREHSA